MLTDIGQRLWHPHNLFNPGNAQSLLTMFRAVLQLLQSWAGQDAGDAARPRRRLLRRSSGTAGRSAERSSDASSLGGLALHSGLGAHLPDEAAMKKRRRLIRPRGPT
jgi:hypothetical protein